MTAGLGLWGSHSGIGVQDYGFCFEFRVQGKGVLLALGLAAKHTRVDEG